jgi:hypothetical protein
MPGTLAACCCLRALRPLLETQHACNPPRTVERSVAAPLGAASDGPLCIHIHRAVPWQHPWRGDQGEGRGQGAGGVSSRQQAAGRVPRSTAPRSQGITGFGSAIINLCVWVIAASCGVPAGEAPHQRRPPRTPPLAHRPPRSCRPSAARSRRRVRLQRGDGRAPAGADRGAQDSRPPPRAGHFHLHGACIQGARPAYTLGLGLRQLVCARLLASDALAGGSAADSVPAPAMAVCCRPSAHPSVRGC